MHCPYCDSKIPDGSNVCMCCSRNLLNVRQQAASASKDAPQGAGKAQAAASRKNAKKNQEYTKGSRGSRKNADRTPMIVAFGLILILIVIIAMIVRSMFGTGSVVPPAVQDTFAPQQGAQNAPEGGFTVFGQETPGPTMQRVTPTPAIEITPTPAPTAEPTYKTLRKGDQGPEVVTLQQALTELGYLSGAQDGNFGTGTMTAVKKFQEDRGLDADGIAGKLTQEALFRESTVTPIPETTVGPDDIMNLPG